jgi:hypothetical protein
MALFCSEAACSLSLFWCLFHKTAPPLVAARKGTEREAAAAGREGGLQAGFAGTLPPLRWCLFAPHSLLRVASRRVRLPRCPLGRPPGGRPPKGGGRQRSRGKRRGAPSACLPADRARRARRLAGVSVAARRLLSENPGGRRGALRIADTRASDAVNGRGGGLQNHAACDACCPG